MGAEQLAIENACVRVFEESVRCFERRDAAAARELYAVDSRFEDRRRGLGHVALGGDARYAMAAGFRDMAMSLERLVPVAVRGERLALLRVMLSSHDGYEVEFLSLHAIGEDRRMREGIAFDADDLRTAVAELDQRYLASAEATVPATKLMIEYIDAYNSRDAQRLQDLQTTGFRMIDHRPAGAGELDVDESRRYVEELWALLPRFCMYAERIVRVDPGGGVLSLRTVAETADGGPIEIHVAILALLDESATRVSRFEIFAIEDTVTAERRYDELTS